jgi:hypothetical protein
MSREIYVIDDRRQKAVQHLLRQAKKRYLLIGLQTSYEGLKAELNQKLEDSKNAFTDQL